MATSPPPDARAMRTRQQAIWDRAAPGWHRHSANLDAGDTAVTDRLLELARIGPGRRVLDLACGTGDPALAIAAMVSSTGAVVGLDLSRAMVEAAQTRAQEQGLSNATFRQVGSELDLGLAVDETFDAATCRFGVMFFPDPVGSLRTVRHALRPGARIALSTWGPPERVPFFSLVGSIVRRHATLPPAEPPRFTTADALEQLLRDAGFTEIETETVEAVVLAAESPADFWDIVTRVAGPLGTIISAQPEEIQRAIREDAVSTLSERFGDGPVRLGGEAVVAAATNPA